MPRSVDVILRNNAVDKAKAGDKCTFNGTLVVVPDVRQLYKAGAVPTSHQRSDGGTGGGGAAADGFTGLKALGVRDLTYKTAFLASYVFLNWLRDTPPNSLVDWFTQAVHNTQHANTTRNAQNACMACADTSTAGTWTTRWPSC